LKTGNYSVLFSVISNMAIGLCFVPFLFLIWKKIRQVNTYWVLGIYWLFNGLVNWPVLQTAGGSHGLISRLSWFYTLTETPLVLLAFAWACSGKLRKQLLWVLTGYVLGEIVLISWKGHALTTSVLIFVSGTLLILGYSISGLVQYVKRMEHTRFENSMVYVYAALLFAYGSGGIIYIFAHYNLNGNSNNDTDSFLLYYISLLLSAIVTSTGLWSYGIRRTGKAYRPTSVQRTAGYSSSSS
jgi:hypothetical protein